MQSETSGVRKDKVRIQIDKVTAELREKVKTKMEVGKFFAGFITLLIGILFDQGNLDATFSRFGVILLVASLGFCISAVFCYDRLLMPREYWTALSKVEKSEERFQDHLKEEMVRTWSCLFVPAVISFGAGFLLLLLDVLLLDQEKVSRVEAILLIGGLGAAALAPVLLGKLKGPRIYD